MDGEEVSFAGFSEKEVQYAKTAVFLMGKTLIRIPGLTFSKWGEFY